MRTRADLGVRSSKAAPAPTSSMTILSTDLPTMIGWLSMLIIGGAVVAGSVHVLPYWPIAHEGVDWTIAATMLPYGLVMWATRKRSPEWTVHAGLLVGIAAITVSVWSSGPTAESQAPALFYGFLSAFASAFLPRRLALTYLALAGVEYLSALLTHWRADMATQWAMNMFAIVVPCLVITTLVGRLRNMALQDSLTGLPNRRHLEDLLRAEIAAATRDGGTLAIAAIDLDGLKQVNDNEGHAAGDALLKAATRGWVSALRGGDLVARVGGDEFVLVLPDSDLDGAEKAVQRLRDAVPQVRFSAGLVSWNQHSLDELLRRADAGLYAAKKIGGGTTVTDPTAAWNSTLDAADPSARIAG